MLAILSVFINANIPAIVVIVMLVIESVYVYANIPAIVVIVILVIYCLCISTRTSQRLSLL